jgi:class 3 adenylate cyclase
MEHPEAAWALLEMMARPPRSRGTEIIRRRREWPGCSSCALLVSQSRLFGMRVPETRYTRSGDVSIAYQVLGEGPFDVVIAPGSVSHVELIWEAAGTAALLRGVAERARVLVFDKRGTGLSDRVAGVPTLEERSDDIRAVMDAAGSDRAALFAISEGVPLSVVLAATYPERVSALVLYGGMARTLWAPDYLFGATERALRRAIEEEEVEAFTTPGGLETFVRSGMPSADEDEVQAIARMIRYGASPGSIEALERMNTAIDVRRVLPVIRAPTLVLHQRADPWVRVEQGRYLARHIPGSAYVELDGGEHIPSAATAPQLLAHVLPFLQEAVTREAPGPDKVLATVLFSDIVGSTARAAELGDMQWRQLLAEHHARVRQQLARFRGAEMDTTGDGFFARFDGPARAIRCAVAIRDAVRELGLQVRLGLHTGECELLDTKLAGIAVSIGARVSALANPGEVLVSQTVKDLVVGSGITFEDRGPAQLKGVPGEWRLYSVTPPNV